MRARTLRGWKDVNTDVLVEMHVVIEDAVAEVQHQGIWHALLVPQSYFQVMFMMWGVHGRKMVQVHLDEVGDGDAGRLDRHTLGVMGGSRGR